MTVCDYADVYLSTEPPSSTIKRHPDLKCPKPQRVRPIQRVILNICIKVEPAGLSDRIGLQEAPQPRVVVARAGVIQPGLRVVAVAGIAEPGPARRAAGAGSLAGPQAGG